MIALAAPSIACRRITLDSINMREPAADGMSCVMRSLSAHETAKIFVPFPGSDGPRGQNAAGVPA